MATVLNSAEVLTNSNAHFFDINVNMYLEILFLLVLLAENSLTVSAVQ